MWTKFVLPLNFRSGASPSVAGWAITLSRGSSLQLLAIADTEVATAIQAALYLAQFGSYSKTYGSFGAVIVLMLWLYLRGAAILIGGESIPRSEPLLLRPELLLPRVIWSRLRPSGSPISENCRRQAHATVRNHSGAAVSRCRGGLRAARVAGSAFWLQVWRVRDPEGYVGSAAPRTKLWTFWNSSGRTGRSNYSE
jgi:hypothetical protein